MGAWTVLNQGFRGNGTAYNKMLPYALAVESFKFERSYTQIYIFN